MRKIISLSVFVLAALLINAQKGGTNSWPIDLLQNGDVYVADSYGKVIDGTIIGDNLGNSIYTKSQRGVIINVGVKDHEGFHGLVEEFSRKTSCDPERT